jgi:hypothetical protein
MERHARLVLWRLTPPFRTTVRLRQISIGSFLDLVRTLAPKVAAAVVRSGPDLITDDDLIRACVDAETVAYVADLVAVDQPVGFLRGWLHGRLGGAFARGNTARLLRACREVEGDGQWTRFLACLNRSVPDQKAKKQGKGGGLMADVLTIAGGLQLDPEAVLAWPMRRFLDMCDALNFAARERGSVDPLSDPDVEPSETISIPGLWQVH